MHKDLLVRNTILDSRNCDIYIKDNIIDKIGVDIPHVTDNILDAKGKYVMPGFVNMHTHAAMTLMRGIGEDMHLMEWLYNKIWPTEKNLDDELVYWGTRLACLEMIKTGTTCFNDQYWNVDAAVKAVDIMGLRSVQPYVILDLGDNNKGKQIKRDCEETYKRSRDWNDRNKFAIGIHAPYSVSEEMLLWGSDFAKKHGLLVHIHISETESENQESIEKHGLTPTKYLDKLGILGPHVIAAHCLWIDDEDMGILAERGVKVVHNVNSNLKIASGYKFRYHEFVNSGVCVSLGTDGCASSNNLDMLETMKTTALLQKGWRGDPTAMPIADLLRTATENGASSLGFNAGQIKEGALADLILIDTDNYAFTPNINFHANLIYSANSSCVDSLICDGKILMKDRKVEGEKEILENVNRLYKKLIT
jgi:5-methylthioadenosine/S-adenosylhomocysteine deaminase